MIAQAATPVAAQAAAPAPDAAAATRGVIAYPLSFFADVAPTSAYDMVIRLPGFVFDKGLAVRGLADSGGNVLIDGQPPVSKTDTVDELLKRIPTSAVDRVELIRGGAPGIDMQGKSVLANVVRKTTGGFRGVVSPSTALIYDGRVENSVRLEGQWRLSGGRLVEISQTISKGPNDDLGDGGRIRYAADSAVILRSRIDADSGAVRSTTNGAYETPLAGGRLRLTGTYQTNPFSTELYDRYVGGGREYEYDRNDKRLIELGARYSRHLSQRLSLEAVAFQQFNETQTGVHFEAPNLLRDFALDRQGSESIGRVVLKVNQSARLTFEGGIEGAFNKLDSKTDLAVNAASVVVPAANVQLQERRGEITLRETWRVSDGLTIEAGLRQERSTVISRGDVLLRKTLQFTKPRLSATWIPYAATQVRLRVEREVGQLNFDDFVATSNVASTGTLTAGNPNLTPQQAWVAEAVLERRFWGGGALVLTARHSRLSDVVDRIPVLGPGGVILADTPGNIGSGRKDELQASVTLPLDRLGLHAAQFKGQATRRFTRVTDPLTGRRRAISTLRTAGDNREVSPVASATWEVHFTQDLPRLKSVWGVDLNGGFTETAYRLTEIETRKLGAQLLVFVEYRARPDLTIRIEGQNISQRDSKRIREVYVGPRSLGVIAYRDVRDLEWGGGLLIRLRKTFG